MESFSFYLYLYGFPFISLGVGLILIAKDISIPIGVILCLPIIMLFLVGFRDAESYGYLLLPIEILLSGLLIIITGILEKKKRSGMRIAILPIALIVIGIIFVTMFAAWIIFA